MDGWPQNTSISPPPHLPQAFSFPLRFFFIFVAKTHAHLNLSMPLPRMFFFPPTRPSPPNKACLPWGTFQELHLPRLPLPPSPVRPPASALVGAGAARCCAPSQGEELHHPTPAAPGLAVASGATAAAHGEDALAAASWTFMLPPLASRAKGALLVGTPQSEDPGKLMSSNASVAQGLACVGHFKKITTE